MKNKLAIFGGKKFINRKFKEFKTHDIKEQNAALKVLKSGILSDFIANDSEFFYGGKYVKLLEEKFKKYFKSNYAISVNSWTSGLVCAVGSLNIKPGDEIIVSPWTMSATATAILAWGGIPIFSEIDNDTYCLDPNYIVEKISKKTRAIVVTDIFGQSANYKKINLIAKKYSLKVISDTAQAIGSKQNNKYSGTLCDIGGFSLNRHKHIHCGEGGIILTDNKKLAENMFKIRNHGEVVNKDNKFKNILGFNFRMNEIEAAISIEQLKKLKKILRKKIQNAKLLSAGLSNLKGLKIPKISKNNTHVYYSFPLQIDENLIKIKKTKILKTLKDEGLPINGQYVNLLDYKIYRDKKIKRNFPWNLSKRKKFYSKKDNVYKQIKYLNSKKYMDISFCKYDFEKKDIDLIIGCFHKVWKNLNII